MHVLLVVYKNQGQIQLVYNEHADALRNRDAIRAEMACKSNFPAIVDAEDDYGISAVIDSSEVRTLVLQDVDVALEGSMKLQMLQQHANASFQKKMAADPKLRVLVPGQPMQGLVRQ